MNLFVSLVRAGAGMHLLREAPVWSPGAKVPRDRVYTRCGYRVPGSRCPRPVIVDGEARPEHVPASSSAVCIDCLLEYIHATGRSLQFEVETFIAECRTKRLGMLRYGNCWRLWTQITGHTW